MIKRGALIARKRILAGIMAVSMLLCSAGCGKKGESSSGESANASTESTVDVKNCTFETDTDYTFDKSIGNISEVSRVGDDIIMLVYEDQGADASMDVSASVSDAYYESGTEKLYSKPIAGGEEKLIYENKEGVGIQNIFDANGNISFIETDKSQKKILKIIDKDGKDVSSINLSELDKKVGDGYISSMKYTKEGYIAATLDKNLIILDETGKIKKEIPFTDYLLGTVITKDGKLLAISYGSSLNSEASEINIETGEIGHKYKLKAQYFLSSNSLQTGSGDYDFYYISDTGFYGYKLESSEDVELCNFNASLIEGNYFTSLIVRDSEHFVISGYDYNTGDQYIEAYRKVDPANVVDKKVMKLACIYASNSLKQAVIDFNKAHSDIRIEIIDYMDSEDPMTKFSTDISAGNIPDLFDVSQGFGNMSITQAVNKNMLVDLTPYFEKDPDISEDDFIESVINATKINGKIYYVGSSFGINSLIARKSDVGNREGWNFDEMKQLIDSKPADMRIFESSNKTTILEYFLYTCMDEFVDWEKGECYFDSQNFKNVLELANRGNNEEDELYNDEELITDIQNGKQLFLNGYITPDMWPLYNKLFNDEGVCIGYPNSDKKGIYASINTAIAMSESCSDKDTAWEFIKFCLSREQQGKSYYANSDGMPTRKDIFELYLDSRSTTKEYTDEFGNNIKPLEGSIGMGNIVVDYKPMTDSEKEQYRKLIEKINKVWEYDKSIMDIVDEESKDYFNGDKSLDEVAKTIQNRAATYINENK